MTRAQENFAVIVVNRQVWTQDDWRYPRPWPGQWAVVELANLEACARIPIEVAECNSPILAWCLIDAQEHLPLQPRRAIDGIAPLLADALIDKQLFRRKECENGLKQLVGLKDSLATSIGVCCAGSDFHLASDAGPFGRTVGNLFRVTVMGFRCCDDGGDVFGFRGLNDCQHFHVARRKSSARDQLQLTLRARAYVERVLDAMVTGRAIVQQEGRGLGSVGAKGVRRG